MSRIACVIAGISVFAVAAPAAADTLNIVGAGISGSYSISSDTTLWSLVGGVTTTTPPGDNAKNAILRYYVVASGTGGATSIFSLGELNPSFGGTGPAPFVSDAGGHLSLVDPALNASGRNVGSLTSLTVLSAPAFPSGPGGQSSAVNLSGLVSHPGSYTQSDLINDFTPVSETVSGHHYTGIPLFTFIDPSQANSTNQIVITSGTDGYEVVLSLAELDPSLGGNPNNLLPYFDANGDFPGSGVARTILPLDNKHGRWESNLVSIEVAAVPEASTWLMMIAGMAALAFAGWRRQKSAPQTA